MISQRTRRNGEKKSKKMFPHPEMFIKKTPEALEKGCSILTLSKKPLQCPVADCHKFISIFKLESHFKYEHKDIPIIITNFDSRSATEFNPRDIRYGATTCIALINVINRQFRGVPKNSNVAWSPTRFYNNNSDYTRPIFVLLATRIPKSSLAMEDEDFDSNEDDQKFDHEELIRTNDRIIVWLCSNIPTSLNYTVAASTLNNEIRVKYFGPLFALGDSPIKMCQEGKCLVLTHFHCIGMSENGQKAISLDVVIHED